jgi:hypothetical protein
MSDVGTAFGQAVIPRGQLQWRGRLRWKWRRFRAALRHGSRDLRNQPIVFGNAIPKSGSKLLFNILRGLQEIGPFVDTGLNEIKPYRRGLPTPQAWINAQLDALGPGDMRFGYLYWTPETERRLGRQNWATYFILRDPRDTIVSEAYYAVEMHPGHALHAFLLSLPDMEARIESLIRGIPDGALRRVNVREHYERFLPWLDHPEVCVIRYEHLVENPDREIDLLLRHLKRRGFAADSPNEALVARLRHHMSPSKSETFRKGGSGGWRRQFSENNRRQFRQVAGDLLRILGYED